VVSVTFFDFNFLLLFWRHPTAFQLAPEAVDKPKPNGFLSTRGIPPHLPVSNLRRSVPGQSLRQRFQDFSRWDQFLCLAFAQLTYRESLRDIEACLRAQQPKPYHTGFRGQVSRNMLAHANEHRDWRIYADFAQVLIAAARDLYRGESLGVKLSDRGRSGIAVTSRATRVSDLKQEYT
jgi:hypothetical protein